MKRISVVALATLALAGCTNPATSAAKAAVMASLKDPSSVQWRNVRTKTTTDSWGKKKPTAVCGEYNAKNGFGGYNGFKDFVYINGYLYTEGDLTAMMQKECP